MTIPQIFNNLTGEQIVFAVYAVVHAVFVFTKWPWIKTALMDGNTPSSLRLCGFMLMNTVMLCEAGQTFMNLHFDTSHLGYLLLTIALLFGIIKASQVLALRGVKDPTEGDKNDIAQ